MSANTAIEWCDHTFNIAWGCAKVSPGCAHCYADGVATRWGHAVFGPAKTTPRRTFGAKHWNDPVRWNRAALLAGRRARVFCSSMCDVFEDNETIDAERAKLWPLIRATQHLDWLLLTKRPERIVEALPPDWGYGYPNVWLGTSVESAAYEHRVRELLRAPAMLHFVSAEPLLGPISRAIFAESYGVDGRRYRIGWVIGGGESGIGAQPSALEWFRDLRDYCAALGVPFFLKQLGGHPDKRGGERAVLDGVRHVAWPLEPRVHA